MKKYVLILIPVLAMSLISVITFGGNLDPNAPPGPTMHTLNEIYELIMENAKPGYEHYIYKEGFGTDKNSYIDEEIVIHNGSGIVHSLILTTIDVADRNSWTKILLIDGDNTIGSFKFNNVDNLEHEYSTKVFTLDIVYKNSLKIKEMGMGWYDITVIYQPEN